MSFLVSSPFPIFEDVDGQPLENGMIYIGTANLNPESNPVPVFWDFDMTQPAAQPIRTSGGYPVRSGTPARIYTAATYSIMVKDSRGKLVFSELESDAGQPVSGVIGTLIDDLDFDPTTLGLTLYETRFLITNASPSNPPNAGGGSYYVVALSRVTLSDYRVLVTNEGITASPPGKAYSRSFSGIWGDWQEVGTPAINAPAAAAVLKKQSINRIATATRSVVLPTGTVDGEFLEIDASEAGVEITQAGAGDMVRMPFNGQSTIGTSGKTIIPPGFYGTLRYMASWFGITGAPVKIADPVTLPTGNAEGAAWSPDGRYLAIAHTTTPFVTIYDWITGSPVKLSDPATLPASNAFGCAWSPDGRYLAIAHVVTPFVTVYDWNTGVPIKVADPATLPAGNATGCAWSPDSRYLAVAHVTTPFVTIYDWITGSPVKIANPATLPPDTGFGASWSPDGRYLAVAHSTSPFVTIYDWITGAPVKITDPATLPAGLGDGAAWSPDGRYLAIAHTTTPFVTIYDWISGVPIKISNPATLPASNGEGVAWSPDGRFLSVVHVTTPFVTVYDWITGTPVKLADPVTLPASTGNASFWSPNGRYLAIAHASTPFITIYDKSVTATNAWKLIPTRMIPGGTGINPVSSFRAFNTYLFLMRTMFR